MIRKIFFIITFIFIFFQTLILQAGADVGALKVMSVNYDDSSSIVYISTKTTPDYTPQAVEPLKCIRLNNPNRIYFDINDAILVGEKQHLIFDKSKIKDIKVSQFETNPHIVRTVITLEEDFDTSKIKLIRIDDCIIVKISTPELKNDYFNPVYEENPQAASYSSIIVNSQAVKKVEIPVTAGANGAQNVMADIQKAFENSTLPNSDGKTYESQVLAEVSSNLKLRTKYYLNRFQPQNGGVLINGVGQLTTSKTLALTEPKRLVFDLPNTYLNKGLRNNEIKICPDGSCKDTAKAGQFNFNTARIVITTDTPEKYIPVYSQDSQSLFIANTDKLNHTALVSNVSNISKAFIKKIDSKTHELILSFSSPVAYSLLRGDNNFSLYLFNVKSYNEQDIIKTLNNTFYKKLTLSLLPQTGVKAVLPIDKTDEIRVEQSMDSRALRITVKTLTEEPKGGIFAKRSTVKDKIVLDAGHGGSDYGAIREGINEKDITLDVTRRVDALLRSKGYKTALTRKDDSFVSLEDRVEFSENESPEIFVSIHVNSAVSESPSGIETHYYHDYSKQLAEVIHKHLVKEIPSAKDRGLFKSKFYVINHTTVPAVLVEIGFISNADERNELITDSRKQKTAKAIADGIIEFLKNNKSGGK